MASYRKRGAHAARPVAAPFVAVKRVPQKGAGENAPQNGHVGDGSGEGARRVPVTGGNRGSGRKMRGVSGLRTRTSLPKVIAAVLVIGFGAVGFAGGLWSTPSAEPTVQAFLLAWQQHQYQAAAELTTGKPEVVATALQDAYLQLDAAAFFVAMGPISQHGNTAHAAFSASVDLGQDGPPWDYSGSFDLRQTGSGWKVVWSPSVINPGLRPGLRLAVVSSTPRRALLEDANGASLQLPSTAYVAGVRPDRLTHPAVTAARLGRITKLDPSQLLGCILAAPKIVFPGAGGAPPGPVQPDGQPAGPGSRPDHQAGAAPAVQQHRPGRGRVGGHRDLQHPARPGHRLPPGRHRGAFRAAAGPPARPGRDAHHQGGDGDRRGRQVAVLRSWPGQASRPVRTTIDSGLQTAADTAMESLPQSAAAVAVQASTGRILTVAQHTAGGTPAIDPLAGRYPPGPAFTIVSTAALLAGGLSVNTQVPCHSVNDVGGRIFTNVPPEPGLGAQPAFRGGFRACVRDRVQRPVLAAERARPDGRGVRFRARRAVAAAAAELLRVHAGAQRRRGGRGGHDRRGQRPGEPARHGHDRGPGGHRHPARAVADRRAGQHHPGPKAGDPPFSAANLATLRTLMRATVQNGAATEADLAGQQVYGQVGTVAMRTGKHPVWASWFVGYRGDVAIAVLELSHSPATSAAPLAAQILAAAP